jgi:hypothetical protein
VTDWSSLVSAALMGFLDIMRHILPPDQAAGLETVGSRLVRVRREPTVLWAAC